jgi:carboxypeptidase family protein/TonB-dependent receptor-like protein
MRNRHPRRPSVLVFAGVLLVLSFPASPGQAQDSRGSISGRVSDVQGGVLPGATVSVVNLGTNAATTMTTGANGQYTALYLNPGQYAVTVELDSFRKVRREVAVGVGEKVQLDLTLEPGSIKEEIVVTAEQPLLESGSATLGQTIGAKLISEMPLGDGTAYSLTRLVPGASFERAYALQRPMDNDNLRGLTVSGTINSEFTIDGSSNVVSQARVGIQPPADAIQEFKVETAVYDAQIGHTGAGNVNLALKSGTNDFHGAMSFYNRDDSRSASLFASNARGAGVTPRDYNRFSGTFWGPIIRNKTFFMVSYERLQDDTIETVTGAVPTDRMRRGDFSELLPLGIQIYDPRTARLVNGVVVRDPFPGNIIPADRINPVAAAILGYYPGPNQAGNADFTGNFFAEQPWTYGYDFEMMRLDHNWSADHRTYVRFLRNFRREERYNWAGVQKGIDITRGGTDRFNYNLALGHTAVLSPSTVLDLKASFLRFNDDQTPASSANDLDLATLGFPADTVALFRGYTHVPMFNIDGNATTCPATPSNASPVLCLGGNQNGFNSGRKQPFYNLQVAPTLTKTFSGHTVKAGYDWRSLRQNEVNEGFKGGAFQFDSTYTRAASNVAGRYGQGIAAFLLGLPTNSSFIETRSTSSYEVVSHGFFVHDDWRVSSKLTLNVGLRYDLEMGMTESQNRNTRGFDLTTPNPIQAQARALYAANPPAGVPYSADQFAARIVGGYQYASEENPHIWNADKNNFQPRLGFTYKLTPKSLLRGGVGLYVAPFQIQGIPGVGTDIDQFGFSRNTLATISQDGIVFQGDLSHPVNTGQLLAPIGASRGLLTNLGGNVGSGSNNPARIFSLERTNPQFWRFSLGLERELPWNMVVEVSYLGQIGQHLPILQNLNYVPQQFRSQGPTRDAAAETFLTQTVANPFQGLFPDNQGVNGATIARRRLLLQYPQFDLLNIETDRGSNRYHAAFIRLDKRFAGGFMLSTSYTYSRFREKTSPLNPWEDLEDRISPVDRPHRVTLATVAELPFGRGRKWGRDWKGLADAVLGGWQFTAKFEWQTGQPLTWNNVYFDPGCGDPRDALQSTWGHDAQGRKYGVDIPIIDTTCFYTLNGQPFRNAAGQLATFGATEIQLSNNSNVRRFPTTLPNVRFQNHHLLDVGLTKNFNLGQRVRLQLRAEALNATNYTIFNSGNITGNNLVPTSASFGKLTNIDSSTVIKPRDIQIGARVTF